MRHTRIEPLVLALMVVALALLIAIAAGTLYAFASGRVKSPAGRSGTPLGQRDTVPMPELDNAVFGDIGTLRAATADPGPVIIVVVPWIPYPADDIPFREELVSKTRSIRALILDWFRSHTLTELSAMGESAVKAALLERINEQLVLGSVPSIWFSEYLVLD